MDALKQQPNLFELAASDDLPCFRSAVETESSSDVNQTGLWYCRHHASNKMGWCEVTLTMIASMYGSLKVLLYLLEHDSVDLNSACGADMSTALHYAAAGDSENVVETVGLLLSHGADLNLADAYGMRPFDVVNGHRRRSIELTMLRKMLAGNGQVTSHCHESDLSTVDANPCLQTIINRSIHARTPASESMVMITKNHNLDSPRESSVDGSICDGKTNIYTSDDFRMYSFKVRPCIRAYSHDWTECPFVHAGENARRRDPRKFHYSCVPCPDFRKGSCGLGDACEYAHGIFESWLHPAQYRTRLCKDGTNCTRKVCFFAHTKEELRPLYVSSSSAVPSPRGSGPSIDNISMGSPIGPTSPSSFFGPFSVVSSASQSCISSTQKGSWCQSSAVPQLTGIVPTSRLRCPLNPIGGFFDEVLSGVSPDYESKSFNTNMLASTAPLSIFSNAEDYNICPVNLDDIFASEALSPPLPMYSGPYHGTNSLQSQMNMHTKIQGMLSRRAEGFPNHQIHENVSVQPAAYIGSTCIEDANQHSITVRNIVHREMQGMASVLADDAIESSLTAGGSLMIQRDSQGECWHDWGCSTQMLAFGACGDHPCKMRSSSLSFDCRATDEPDISWVHRLVKDAPGDSISPLGMCSAEVSCTSHVDESDSVLGFWLEQMQLDEIAV